VGEVSGRGVKWPEKARASYELRLGCLLARIPVPDPSALTATKVWLASGLRHRCLDDIPRSRRGEPGSIPGCQRA
jgi:hypothetical protein